jgi:putative ABC transport system ATP-binding protein
MSDKTSEARSEAITIRAVTKTYAEGTGGTLALDGVDLAVQRGEVMLLMGPSGSGKTTLLSIMGCILRPTSGQVVLSGNDVTAMSEKSLPALRLKHIGFVFQGFNLFPTLTAGENVELSLKLKGLNRTAAKSEARRLLSLVSLDGKYDAFPADLSGGQKQRVAIARAVAGSPETILADEPTAALDSHTGRSVVEMMSMLAHKENRAVVIVTHDNRLVDYADRIVRIEDGRVASAA